jgi:hypothetical protein
MFQKLHYVNFIAWLQQILLILEPAVELLVNEIAVTQTRVPDICSRELSLNTGHVSYIIKHQVITT